MSSFLQVFSYYNNSWHILRRKKTAFSDLSASCVSEWPPMTGELCSSSNFPSHFPGPPKGISAEAADSQVETSLLQDFSTLLRDRVSLGTYNASPLGKISLLYSECQEIKGKLLGSRIQEDMIMHAVSPAKCSDLKTFDRYGGVITMSQGLCQLRGHTERTTQPLNDELADRDWRSGLQVANP